MQDPNEYGDRGVARTGRYGRMVVPCFLLILTSATGAAAEVVFAEAVPLSPLAASDSGDDSWPNAATDRKGTWIAVWSSEENLDGEIGTDSDILFSRSLDYGVSWTWPTPLNSNASTDSGLDAYPHIATDTLGNWIVVWYSSEDIGGSGSDWDICYSRSSDNGTTWSPPALLNTNATSDSGLDVVNQVVTDGSGRWIAVWSSNENLGGTAGDDFDILFARSFNNGETWTPPALLNQNGTSDDGSDAAASVVACGSDTWVAVWEADKLTLSDDPDLLVSRSTDNGGTWSLPEFLNNDAEYDMDLFDQIPHAASDGQGGIMVMWDAQKPVGRQNVYFSRSSDYGETWSDMALVSTNAPLDSGNDWLAHVATDGAGTWVVLWTHSENLGDTVVNDDAIYSFSTDFGSSWADPVLIRIGEHLHPRLIGWSALCSEGTSQWLALWESNDDMSGTIGTDFDILISRGTVASCVSDPKWRRYR